MKNFHVSYDIVTYESAEHGDAESRGFVTPGGWHFELTAEHHGDAMAPILEDQALSLREAIGLMGCCEDSGTWFTECDGRQNFQTGAVETRSLHCPDGITAASYERIARLLGVRS